MDSTAPAPAPTDLANALVDLLTIEELDTDLYRGRRLPGGVGRVFGGQVIAQGLQAAQRSNEAPKTAPSLHAYFMRPGNEDHPTTFLFVTDSESRAYATRSMLAITQAKPPH